MAYTVAAVPDLSGKVIVVTGGNSGIGFEAARVFVDRGARVVLACRDAAKMATAATALASSAKNGGAVDQVVLDLSSLPSVREAAASMNSKYDKIDVLVNNAGVMHLPYRETKDGFEMQFGTNHFGHFALTGLLFDKVNAAPAGRVVTVSSLLHHKGELRFEDIPKPAKYDEQRAYSMSKLANVLFARELHRRSAAAGKKVMSLACHPGYSATNLQAAGPAMAGSKVMGFVMAAANALIAQSAAAGALGTLRAATGTDVKGGDYVGSVGLNGLRGPPEVAKPSDRALDDDVARRLWERSEELTGVRYGI